MTYRSIGKMLASVVFGIAFAGALATPREAAAQTSFRLGVFIGGQGRYGPPAGLAYGRNAFYQFAFNTGYEDGYDKGRDDGKSRHSYDPMRHKRFRQADRRYERGYGPKIDYQGAYRNGFRAGYDAGYRERSRYFGQYRRPGSWSY
jgi:hypothetical protein